VQAKNTQNIEKLGFDPVAERAVGGPIAVTNSSGTLAAPSISPDGQEIVHTLGNIFSLKLGSLVLNQLTDETTNEVYPVWSPDGKQIAYYSNKNGVYQVYIMNPDGSGARQITEENAPGAVLPVWSPDGSQLAYSIYGGKSFILDMNKTWREQTPIETPFITADKAHFVAGAWSPDGKYIVGSGYRNRFMGLMIFSIDKQSYELISEFGASPRWMSDSRRLLFAFEENVYLVDTQSKKPREICSFAPDKVHSLDISKDNRSIYVSVAKAEADIWLLRLE
jgi:Tol biopolymer transport system component